MIQLDSNQQRAKDLALAWFHNSSDSIFKIFGYAGAGKTTIVSEIVKDIEGRILYGAYTDKAAEEVLPLKDMNSRVGRVSGFAKERPSGTSGIYFTAAVITKVERKAT